MSCTVEILSVGNELLLGNTVNTNASWIAAHVTSLGGFVSRITTVADNLKEISGAIRESIKRKPSFLITTGGIGPTFDDMTLAGVAQAFNMPIRANKIALEMIREHYARRFPDRRLVLTEPRVKMARMPIRGTPIRNPVGTAPALRLNVRGTTIFCLPGVPKEAKAIFRETVSRAIGARSGGMIFTEIWLEAYGVMESTLAPMIDRVMARWHGVYIKSHPRGIEADGRPHIELHFSIASRKAGDAEKVILEASRDLASQLRRAGAKLG